MTFDELKKEAKRQGYNLIKIKPRENSCRAHVELNGISGIAM